MPSQKAKLCQARMTIQRTVPATMSQSSIPNALTMTLRTYALKIMEISAAVRKVMLTAMSSGPRFSILVAMMGQKLLVVKSTPPELPEQFGQLGGRGAFYVKLNSCKRPCQIIPGNMSCIVIHFRQWAQCPDATVQRNGRRRRCMQSFHVGTFQQDQVLRRKNHISRGPLPLRRVGPPSKLRSTAPE